MHLVIISPFPPSITGIGQYGYHVTRALATSGLFSRLTVLAGAGPGASLTEPVEFAEIEYCWEPGRFDARAIIVSRLKQLNPDLVWFNLGASIFGKSPWKNLSGLLTPFYARRSGYPTIVTLHELVELADLRALNAPGGPLAFLGARLLTSVTTQADVVCLTLRHYVEWFGRNRPEVECVHIPHGTFHEPELLSPSNEQKILFFATLTPYKGLELLLGSLPRLQEKYPRAKLVIAGTEHTRFPHYGRELKSRFNGMRGVEWIGQVHEAGIKDLFHRAQIVVLPYTAATGASSVLYRAAAWGRPVVASDISEIRTLTQESSLRVEFFENGNRESLQDALDRLLGSSSIRDAQVEQNFHSIQSARLQVTCQRYVEAFNHALDLRKSSKRIPLRSGIKFA